jgi:hypothetical protein
VVDADAAGVYLLDEERGHLTFAAQQGLSDEATHDFDALPGEEAHLRALHDALPNVMMSAIRDWLVAAAGLELTEKRE